MKKPIPPTLEHLKNTSIILGSASPRRAELLAGMGIEYEIIVSNSTEYVPEHVPVSEYAEYLSKLKSKNLRDELDINLDSLLITADTVVIHQDRILNKPTSIAEAKSMLASLSDTTHIVQTGITVLKDNITITKSDIATVRLNPLQKDEIDYYANLYRPIDKAGAYGIQEWIGMTCIKAIKGSFYTIMGLPTHLLYDILKCNFK